MMKMMKAKKESSMDKSKMSKMKSNKEKMKHPDEKEDKVLIKKMIKKKAMK
jgi:hypothetical protein